MDETENILTGQGAQQNLPARLDTSVANDLLAQVRQKAAEKAAGATRARSGSVGKFGTNVRPQAPMAGTIKNLVNSPGSRGDDGLYGTEEIQNRRNIAWIPSETDKAGIRYAQDETSRTDVIIKDSIKQFGMSLMTLEDKAYIALGGIVSKATDNEFGKEMRDRAYESLDAKLYDMSLVATREPDVETLTAKITMGASSMLEMMAVGAMTGGYGALVQMGIMVAGDGTYNNMLRYAEENSGSIDGYEGNWVDIGIDLANAAAQVVIERKLGLGSGKLFAGTRGTWLRETINGFAQEASEEFLSDFGEVLKGNRDAQILADRWQDYMIGGAIGGVLQGALGAATYKGSRAKADASIATIANQVIAKANSHMAEAVVQKQAQQFAKQFNDKVEVEFARDMYQELSDRTEANFNKGPAHDLIVQNEMANRGADMTLADTIDMQAEATEQTIQALREAYEQGKSVMETAEGREFRPITPKEMNNTIEYYVDNAFKAMKMQNQTAEFKNFWNPIAEHYGIKATDTFMDTTIRAQIISDYNAGQASARLQQSFDTIKNLQEGRKDKIQAARVGKQTEAMIREQSNELNDAIEKAIPTPAVDNIMQEGQIAIPPNERSFYETGEVGERAQSARIRDMLAQQGVLDGARSEYKVLASKEMARDAALFAQANPQVAMEIAMGRAGPRGGIDAEVMFIAVRNHARANNNVYKLHELQSSPIQAKITESAQKLSGIRNLTGDGNYDVAKIIHDVNKMYGKNMTTEQKAAIQQNVEKINSLIERADLNKQEAWNNILKGMECP